MGWHDFLGGDQGGSTDPLDILKSIAGSAVPQNAVAPVSRIPNVPAAAIPQKPMPGPIERAVTPGGGVDVRALLEQIGPLIGSMALHEPGQRTGFLSGYMQGQQLGRAEKQKKDESTQAQKQAASRFLLEVGQHALAIDDPVQRAQFVDLAGNSAETAGLMRKDDPRLVQLREVPASQAATAKLKELSDLLDGVEKNGYNLDELAQAGAHIRTKSGEDVPVQTAIDLTRKRPLGTNGTPIAKPAATGKTAEERFMAKKAKELGKTVDQLTAKEELDIKTEYANAGRDRQPPTPSETERAATLLGQIRAAKAKGDTATAATLQTQYDDLQQVRKDTAASGRDPLLEAIRALQANAGASGGAAVDASRPDPKTANQPDKLTGLTPNAVYQNAVTWAVTGAMTSQGMGANPRAKAARDAIQNKGSAIVADAGVDIPTLRAEYTAYRGTLGKLLPTATATAGFVGTATDNLDLALEQSAKVGRTGSRLVNHYAQWAQGSFTPATGLSELELYVYTAAREYAKVTSGGAMSAQGLTDSAAREAEKLLSAAQAPETLAAVATGMKKDMANVVKNQTAQIAKVSSTIANFLKVTAGVQGDTTPTTDPAAGRGAVPSGAPSYQDYLRSKGGK